MHEVDRRMVRRSCRDGALVLSASRLSGPCSHWPSTACHWPLSPASATSSAAPHWDETLKPQFCPSPTSPHRLSVHRPTRRYRPAPSISQPEPRPQGCSFSNLISLAK